MDTGPASNRLALLTLLAVVCATTTPPGLAQVQPAQLVASSAAPPTSAPRHCAPAPAPSPPPRRPAPAPVTPQSPVLQCGDAVSIVTLAPSAPTVPTAATAGSAAAPKAPASATAKAPLVALDPAERQWLQRTAYAAWAMLALAALVLLVLGLAAAVWRGGVAVRGHSGGFGGRGSGWEISPALAMLAAAALAGTLATVLMLRMLSATAAPPPDGTAQAGRSAAR